MNTILSVIQTDATVLQLTTYNLQLTTYNLQLTTYNLQLTTYNLQLTACGLTRLTLSLTAQVNYHLDVSGVGAGNNGGKSKPTFNITAAVSPVPEVGTASMMLLGHGLMGFIGRRRRNAQA